MKKAEFLKQENVPQFIKDLVEKAPDDAEIECIAMSAGKKEPTAQKGECFSCNDCGSTCNEDGINIGPYIEVLFTQLKEIADMADCKGKIKVEDVDLVKSILDTMESSKDNMADYLNDQKRLRSGKAAV